MASQDDFQQAMHDIYKFSPLIGLEGQALLQGWVKRLAEAGSENQARALDYAQYLAYQLQRAQLRFPFSQPPAKGELPDLKEVLFGADSVQDAASLNISSANQVPRRPPLHTSLAVAAVKSARERSITYADYSLSGTAALNKESPHTSSTQEDSRSHSHRQNRSATSDWESRIADPKCEKDINAQLEELAEDAPLWLLLARVCSHTRDGGALMHAVVAEELAEWSAHLASDQTMASKLAPEQNDSEEEWGPRVDRRADYWSEVSIVWKRLHSEDKEASEQLATQVKRWLNQQDRQLQAEQAQLQALTEEVEEIKRQVVQSQKWRESQFEVQNRVLQAEVNALKQSIIDNTRRIKDLKDNQRDPNTSVGSPLPEDKHRMSISQDSLNTSNF